MPRRKKNALPKEELKFVESPKFVYHRSNFPVVHLSNNPVTLKYIPAEDVCKKWVTPCFNDLPATKGRGRRRPRGRGAKSLATSRSNFVQTNVTSAAAPDSVAPRKRPLKLKPIVFRGLNDRISDVEDVSNEESDGCLVEPEEVEEGNAGSRLEELEERAESPKPVVVVDLTSARHDDTNTSDADEDISAREELTFPGTIPDIMTPEDSGTESPAPDPFDADRKPSDPFVPDSVVPPGDAFSPQSLSSNASQSMLQERSHTYSPLVSHRQQSSHHESTKSPAMPPSITRDPLPVFLPSLSSPDYSAGSAEWFRAAFLDRAEEMTEPTEIDPRAGADESSTSPSSQVCNLFRSISVATPRCNPSGGTCLAGNTPEAEQGVPCRARQVKNCPKILRLVNKTANKRPP